MMDGLRCIDCGGSVRTGAPYVTVVYHVERFTGDESINVDAAEVSPPGAVVAHPRPTRC